VKTAVVTGGTRGIGLGLARELLARGCQLVVCGRSTPGVEAAVRELGHPDRVLGVPCDVTDAGSVQALWDAAVARFGRVDIWINNAGTTTTPLPLWEVSSDEVRCTVETNLLGTLFGMQVAARGMREQSGGGQIFNIEGMGSKGEVQEGLLPYACTKAAVGYLDKAFLKELKGSAVQICSIRPGINVTEHLLHGADALSPERWEKTKRIFNILGDRPETTTPYLAEQILATSKTGTKIAWLTPARISGRFLAAPFRKRDLFAGLDPH
jgi:NAD(P)-dependent dehydrogenase (short-subunit alcohol dehydrogenase family)